MKKVCIKNKNPLNVNEVKNALKFYRFKMHDVLVIVLYLNLFSIFYRYVFKPLVKVCYSVLPTKLYQHNMGNFGRPTSPHETAPLYTIISRINLCLKLLNVFVCTW